VARQFLASGLAVARKFLASGLAVARKLLASDPLGHWQVNHYFGEAMAHTA